MKKRLSLCMMMMLSGGFVAADASAQNFKDVPKSHQFYEEITELSEQGVINGYSDNTFRPNDSLTRGQAAKILARALQLNVDAAENANLADISPTHQYYGEISALKEIGVLSGFEDNTFRAGQPLQRHHIAKMLSTAFMLNPFSEKDFPFNDVPDDYQYYVMALYDNDVTKGKTATTFDGRTSITRGQMAAFLSRAKAASNIESITLRDNMYSNESMLYDTNWKSSKHDAIYATDDTITVVEANEDVEITTYDENYRIVNTKTIDLEMPLFGAFYHGEKYNYIAFGHENPSEQNLEVIRIVKYDHDFNRIDSVSLYGDDITTVVPFSAASGGQMAEQGNHLVYHTSRKRYKSDDNLNHQSQLTIEIDTSTMRVINDVELFPWNHVSHSFDQYVLFNGDEPIYLDHGDAYPRSVVLHKQNDEKQLDVYNIPGNVGDNFTGVTIGGFEQSDTHYLAAFNAVSPSRYTIDKPNRNIHIVSVDKQTLALDTSRINYEPYPDTYTTPPKLVKINDDKFLVLWQNYVHRQYFDFMHGAYLDGEGNFISGTYTYPNAQLSQAQPVVFQESIVWNLSLPHLTVLYSIARDE